MERQPILLDPHGRRLASIFTTDDLGRLHAVADVRWARDEAAPEDEIDHMREDLAAIITGRWRYGEVTRFPKLRAILEVSGGFPSASDLDYRECFARGIRVLSCAPAFGPAVAEMAMALALACTRQVAWTDRAFRAAEPNWSHVSFETAIGTPFTLYGRTVGLIGFGGLARALMPLLAPFACPTQVYDPWLTDAYLSRHGVTPVSLEKLLDTSKVIFVLAVPTKENRALLDRSLLERIRPDAVLLLMSRSHVVDFDALTELLLSGRFRAGIDVFPEEPLPRDHPIRRAEHAVLSSHRAGAIGDGLLAIGRLVADDVEAICAGLVPRSMQHAEPEFIRMRGM